MPADYLSKQGDSAGTITQQLTSLDGSSPNLTGATVVFNARALSSPQPLSLTGSVSVSNPATGVVQFVPSAADTATPGMFMATWTVTFQGGGVQTFPTSGYFSWEIEQNLTTAGGQQIVSLPEVKDYLTVFGVGVDRSHDAKLLSFINAATPVIENAVGPVIVRQFEEWHDGGQYWIKLRRRPSSAIGTNPVLTLVGVDEYRGPIKYTLSIVPTPAAATTYSCMLDARMGTVYRRTTGGGVIPFGAGPWGGGMPDAVHVVYQAGQNPVPENVREAAKEAVRVNYMQTMATGIGSRSIADEMDRSGPPLGFYLPRRALELLSPMRRAPAIA